MIVAKDPKIVIAKDETRATFTWRGRPGPGWVLLGLSMLVGASFLYMSGTPLNTGEPRSLGDKVSLFVFMLPFCAWLGYAGLVNILNSTVITADRETVTQSNGPLPIKKRVSIPAVGIQQFIVVQSVESRAEICAVDSGHVARPLGVLPSVIAAHQVAYELHQFYGIEERPVAGFGRVLNASPPV